MLLAMYSFCLFNEESVILSIVSVVIPPKKQADMICQHQLPSTVNSIW